MEALKELLPELNFDEEIKENPELEKYIKKECNEAELTFTDPMKLEEAPKLNSDFRNYVLLCGLPIVDEGKKEKLLKVIINVLKKKGFEAIDEENITILLKEDTGKSYGTAFIKCDDETDAKLVQALLHGFALGKANKIQASTFDEFDRLLSVNDEYVPPRFADLTDLYSYAMDPQNDQFLIREENEIKVKMNRIPNRTDKETNTVNFHEELVGPNADIQIISKKNAFWSPQGRYLVIFKENMVQLYGGSVFELVREIVHAGVSNCTISPCERYIMTFTKEKNAGQGNYMFWRIDTGEMLRSFSFDDYTPKNSPHDIFKFSFDGNYVAKMITDHIAVYELPDMQLLEDMNIGKRVSIRIEHINDFKWSPAKNMICYWFRNPEDESNPPKVGFIHIPTREVWSEREIINGVDLITKWSTDGSKLITINKLKRKKQFFNTVSVFDVNSKGIPAEMISINTNILNVSWTSATDRIAILANREKKIQEKWADKSQIASTIVFEVKQRDGVLKSERLGTTKEHITNDIEWAENGNIFIASDIKNANPSYQGKFYVYYIRNVVTKEEVKAKGGKGKKGKGKAGKTKFVDKTELVIDLVDEIEDLKADTINWDPTGRFFSTSYIPAIKSMIRAQTTPKFTIYNAKGDEIYSYSVPKLQQFAWRPRPIRNWSEKVEKEFQKEYNSKLKKVLKAESDEKGVIEMIKVTKEKTKEKFMEVFAPFMQRYKDTKKERLALCPDDDSDEEEEFERSVIADYY
ncbi:unnamed protein product [Moneuplotes crassus]|uniref:Eukaryotic translation initiation factor 3 subunit B n=1 Tax=Euplotes crassus TaxID=5936 RepID=A0AAD1Y8N1_EUPCR|nr:unnamed protein product [Moneuplotes crassus]